MHLLSQVGPKDAVRAGSVLHQNPKSALRGSHPYGGAEKVAMMQWAKTGCQ